MPLGSAHAQTPGLGASRVDSGEICFLGRQKRGCQKARAGIWEGRPCREAAAPATVTLPRTQLSTPIPPPPPRPPRLGLGSQKAAHASFPTSATSSQGPEPRAVIEPQTSEHSALRPAASSRTTGTLNVPWVPWWLRGLRIRHCHCCGAGSTPGPGTSAYAVGAAPNRHPFLARGTHFTQ